MNPLKGETPLAIGDGEDAREFILVLDHEALIAAEAAYRKPMAQMMAEASLGFVGAARAMLFGALRANHPKVTLAECGQMMLEHGEAVSEALGAAAEAAFPKSAKAEGREPGKAPAGKSSGRNGAKRGSTPKRSSARPRARSGSK